MGEAMTTNQTIDGVPRDDLELVLLHGHSTHESDQAWDRLRALLEAPAVQWLAMEVNGKPWVIKEGPNADKWRAMGYELFPVEPAGQNQGEPVACPHEWTDDGEFTLTCTKCDKTENHEPYGWVQTRGNAINHFTQEWDVVESWEDQGFEYKAMFEHAEQPAPVAVAPQPSYRLLGDGDIIQDGDETLNDDTATWGKVPVGVFIGMPYNRRVMLPVRREKS